jgi:hypothetical protein
MSSPPDEFNIKPNAGRTSGPLCFEHITNNCDVIDKAKTAALSLDNLGVTMKIPFVAFIAALVLALASAPASAEPKGQKGKAAATPQVRYFDLSSSIFSELGSEAILKEDRLGATLVSAELDVCHQVSPTSNRLDRFVVPLKIDGNRLTGSVQSQERKHEVSVNLSRRVAGGNFAFEGTITSGPITEKIRSIDNNEVSEEEITDQYLAEPEIESDPTDFAGAWPQTLHVRIERAALTGVLEALHDQNVRVIVNGLQPSCRVLRSGHYTVQVDVDAERIGAVFAKLKSVPGVTEVGFSPNPPNMQRAVRFPSAGWRNGAGKLERDKLAAAIGAAMAKSMAATLNATSWDALMGELTVELKRPDESIPGLKVAQIITVTIVIAPDSLSSKEHSILWIESITPRIVDERPPPRLTFSFSQNDEGEGAVEPDGSDALPEAVAAALKGVPWDLEKEQWRQ